MRHYAPVVADNENGDAAPEPKEETEAPEAKEDKETPEPEKEEEPKATEAPEKEEAAVGKDETTEAMEETTELNPHRLPRSQQKVRMQKRTKKPLYQIQKRQLRLQKRAVPRITAKARQMYLQSRKEALELPHHPQPSRQKKALRKRTMFPRLAPRIWLEWGIAPLQRYM